jgi:hypothetical protein
MDEKMRIDHAGHVTTKPWPTQFDNDPSKWFELTGKIPKREWVGLTEDEIFKLYMNSGYGDIDDCLQFEGLARVIEAKLKEKNSGNP